MMKKQLQRTLYETMKTIQGNGAYIVSGINKFVFPGMHIKGVGDISFPVLDYQTKEMIKVARKAPFGKGMDTITDSSVRSAWEIDAEQITFKNQEWSKLMKKLIKKVKKGLGIEQQEVVPSLYKLLIYEEGDFFLPHKDSEKEKGMFGTLVLGLPSVHSGGELIVKFDGQEETIDMSIAASNFSISFAAFYADCEHEIRPITSGHRVTLVFNLLQKGKGKGKGKIKPPEFNAQLKLMKEQLLQLSINPSEHPIIILLEHQYTPSNFSIDKLKNHDLPRTEALLYAAEQSGYFAKLGLVTCYQMGQLEGVSYGGYRRNRYEEEDLTEGTMGEIYEAYSTIEHWSEDGLPHLGRITIDENDLITDKKLTEGEPINQEAEGFTGNAGMTLEYWYHYGAIILLSLIHI